MSNFYTGQTFYGAAENSRRVLVFKLVDYDEVNEVFYLQLNNTSKIYKVSRYYLGRTLFLSEDNARVTAGLQRKTYFEYKAESEKKDYPSRMYEWRKTDYRPRKGYLEYYMEKSPLQKEDDWSKWDSKIRDK